MAPRVKSVYVLVWSDAHGLVIRRDEQTVCRIFKAYKDDGWWLWGYGNSAGLSARGLNAAELLDKTQEMLDALPR